MDLAEYNYDITYVFKPINNDGSCLWNLTNSEKRLLKIEEYESSDYYLYIKPNLFCSYRGFYMLRTYSKVIQFNYTTARRNYTKTEDERISDVNAGLIVALVLIPVYLFAIGFIIGIIHCIYEAYKKRRNNPLP